MFWGNISLEDRDAMFIRSIGIYPQVYMAVQIRRKHRNLHRLENLQSHQKDLLLMSSVSVFWLVILLRRSVCIGNTLVKKTAGTKSQLADKYCP